MMEQQQPKRYSAPQLILHVVEEDVITTSQFDNIRGIPDGWMGVTKNGGDF